MAKNQRPTLTTTQVAQRAGVHQNTVIAYEAAGHIESVRVGTLRIRLFTPDAVEIVRRVRKQNEQKLADARNAKRA
jgi:DNA-binding transcriptional MerR regulator